ncbi:amidohydrolase [Alkalicella caledoniensis]|uniref:Amidohydrolase n=1 Tax=Alkalicella caledoniensis TaxID=2731377 RepID=A0A7G9W437_ALKCA|nr:M20 family metallopeptidase [Alkalicella caledoniensis]QNO13449.1 amidohydrolase [Alkalicella caledoniensis]
MIQLNNDFLNELTTIRRRLHQVPEISFDLPKTQAIITEYLSKYGYQFEEVAQTGIVAVKHGMSDTAIAFRADMDALMVTEETGVDYTSKHPGQMHACGHDGHMTMLLGLAKYMAQFEDLNRNLVFIFQPAEEGPGGAKTIIEEGILKRHNVEAIFGIHIFPNLDEGKIGLGKGPLMAQNGEVDILVKGRSSHGAMPHKGSDALVAASNLVMSYQSIVSRNLDPLEPAILTLGSVKGGEARNIIANKIELNGTIRAFNPEYYNLIKSKMDSINKGLEEMYDVNIEMEIRDFYPPVLNDENLFETALKSLERNQIEFVKPVMLAEDFAFYQQEIPGLFMFLGSKNTQQGYTHPLHSCYFNYNEKILLEGVKTYISICEQMDVF